MTTTRWMAACAAALALVAPAAAQQVCPAQAPCYPALPQILFPVQAPVAVPDVFEPACLDEIPPREKARLDSIRRRTAEALMQAHAFFMRTGFYHAAEFTAVQALKHAPECAAAECGLALARFAARVRQHTRCGEEACENVGPPPSCGFVAGTGVRGFRIRLNVQANCACGDKCCCKAECACGKDCACKPAARQNVVREVCCPPCMPQAVTWACPGLPVICPQPVAAARMAVHLQAPVRFVTAGNQVRVTGHGFDARGERITALGDGRVLFEGDACIEFRTGNLPAKIHACRIVVNLTDGSYEVNPAAVEPRTARLDDGLRQASHSDACPVPTHKPAWLKGWGVCKPAAEKPVGFMKLMGGDGCVCPRR